MTQSWPRFTILPTPSALRCPSKMKSKTSIGGAATAGVVLKLGLHGGSCIAVTAGGVLDYFGSVVNTASRLEHQCRGGEVIVSEAVYADAEAREMLAGRPLIEDSATLRGLSEPVRFVRVEGRPARL